MIRIAFTATGWSFVRKAFIEVPPCLVDQHVDNVRPIVEYVCL